MADRWLRLEEAARDLATSPVVLRRRLARHARRTDAGVVARVDGLEARKLGNEWRVRLGPWSPQR